MTRAVEHNDDSALRTALQKAIIWQLKRNRELAADLDDDNCFDKDEVQAELGNGKALVIKWERMLALPGLLTLSNNAEA